VKAYLAIGARLRAAREERDLTLKALADSMGVTSSLLSQIETDKVQPSLNTLYQLATRLDLSVDEILGLGPGKPAHPEPAAVVQRQSDNPSLEMSGGVRWERLAGSPSLGLEPLLVTYPPGAASSADGRMVTTAGLEFGLLLSGRLTLRVGFETHVLEAGDSVFFERARPHVYSNDGNLEARGVWFVVRGRTAPAESTGDSGDPTQINSLIDVLRALDTNEDW
jgi:transcriptional regulator with XRE-family HTH domain